MGIVINAFEKKKTFTLAEANELLPLIIKITAKHRKAVEAIMDQLDQHHYSSGEEHPNTFLMEAEVDWHISDWVGAMERLGAQTKGMWMVDFDCGTGYFCWKYPESKVEFYHTYSDGFSSRQRIENGQV